MIYLESLRAAVAGFVELGGPVVALLLAMSVLAVAVMLFKLWQYRQAGVGRHSVLHRALADWNAGRGGAAQEGLGRSPSHIAPLLSQAMSAARGTEPRADLRIRLEAMTESRMGKLEAGFRLLDSIAQLAPLLGLFGTVLGMIDAFRSLQEAGSAVDPSLLAGGIWVALMTTAVGLAVAMPTSLILTWFEARVMRERLIADEALQTILCPGEFAQSAVAPHPGGTLAHAP